MNDDQKEKPVLKEPTAPFWMVTYGDMVTLLMVFFILILSFSTVELEKFQGAMTSMKGALGVLPENISTYKKRDPNFKDYESKKRRELFEILNDIEEVLEKMGLAEIVELEFTGEGVMVRMGDDLLFDSGKARIKNHATPVIDIVLQAFNGRFKEIYVEGHTDNVPIRSNKYPSNWELSGARSMSVIKYLHEKGKIPPRQLTAVGHGEHRPLVENDTRAHRAKNRRVEIFFRM